MHFSLHQLQLFLQVAETSSITKAAETLHLTQPAISIQLRNFQGQFESPLTEMIGKKIYLTDFGKEIAESARVILAHVETVQQKALAQKGALTGRLKISIVSTGKYVMPYFLRSFLKKHQGVELSLDVTNKQQVVASLENNQVDFSLVSVLPEHIRLKRIELMPNYLLLVAGKDLSFPKKIDANMLGNYPLLFREQGSATRMLMERFVSRYKIPLQRKIELSSNEAVKQAVIAGLGLSLMPLIGLKNELQLKQLKIVPFKGLPLKTTWNLVWLKEKQLTPLTDALITHIQTNRERIISEQFKWINNKYTPTIDHS